MTVKKLGKKLIYLIMAIISISITISCGTSRVVMPNELYKQNCKN